MDDETSSTLDSPGSVFHDQEEHTREEFNNRLQHSEERGFHGDLSNIDLNNLGAVGGVERRQDTPDPFSQQNDQEQEMFRLSLGLDQITVPLTSYQQDVVQPHLTEHPDVTSSNAQNLKSSVV